MSSLQREGWNHPDAELFRLLVENVVDYGIFVLDAEGRVASWNPGAERIKGYRAEEIIGQHFSQFYPQEAIDRGWPDYELKVARAVGRFEDEGWRVRKDGSQFWANVVITALYDAAGNFRGFSKITRDLTARKEAEETARRLAEEAAARRVAEQNAELLGRQREQLQVTLSSIGDAVISTDAEGRIDFLNPVAEAMVGWQSAEAVHHKLDEVFRIINENTRQPIDNPAMRALREGRIVGLANHTILIARDGTERPIDDSAAPIRDHKGDVFGSVLVFRDISERKRTESALNERLRLLALNAAVGEALVQSHSLPGMLQRCTDAMVKYMHGAFARIWTLNESENVLELRASSGMYTHLDGSHSRIPVGRYKIGLIAQEKVPHLTNQVVGDPRVSDQEWAKREGMVAFVGYPLIVDNRLVGVMAMFARHTLTETTLDCMASVADEISVGIERKVSEVARHQQQEWLRVTLASIGDAVIATDTLGRVTFLNKIAEALTGWKQEEAQGQPLEAVFTILNEQTRESVENPVTKVLRDGLTVGLGNHTVLMSRDGSEWPIDDSAAPIKDSTGAMIGVVLIFRDVTEQRRVENEVRQSEARKSAILETALDCIITMDHHGAVVEFNPAAEKTFGRNRREVIGQQLAELIIPPILRERHRQGMEHHLSTGDGPVLGKRLELSALRADGTEFPIEVAITRIPIDGPPLFTAYLRDISTQRRAEQNRNTRLAVTNILNEAKSLDEGISAILRVVCENLNWDAGFLWTVQDDGIKLVCRQSWHQPAVSVQEFEHDSRNRRFEPGDGLPGHVWSTSRAEWLPDVTHHTNFPRAASAAKYGLHSAFACPVVGGGGVIGVIEFFSRSIREPDADLLEMMATIAGNIGHFIERRRAETALQRSEGRFRGLMEQAPFSIQVFSPDGRTLRVNRAWEELWGISLEQLGDYNVLEDRQLEAKGILPYLQKGFAGEATFIPAVLYDPSETIPSHSGSGDPRRWVEAMIYPLRDAHGQIQEVVLIHDDISARKQAEEALREAHRELEARVVERTAELARTNEFLKALLENVQTGVVACNAQGVLTLFNSVTRFLHGLPEEPIPPEEWAGRYRLFRPDGLTPMEKADIPLYRALRGEVFREAEMVIRPVGLPPRTVHVSGQAFFDAQGEKLGAVVSMQDVTARKQAEAALLAAHHELERRVAERTEELARANVAIRESEEKLRLLANTIPQLAWMARTDGYIFWYNRRWYDYTGTTPEQMEGWGWQSVHDPNVLSTVMERWQQSITTGDPFDMVFPIKGADGQFRPFLTRVNPLRDQEGNIQYWFGTNTDISEQIQTEEALRQRESQQRFMSEVSAALVGSLHYQSILRHVADLSVPTLGDFCFFDVVTDDERLERVGYKHVDPENAATPERVRSFVPARIDTNHPIPKAIRTGVPEFIPNVSEEWLQHIATSADHLQFLREMKLSSIMTVPMLVGERRLGALTFGYSNSGRRHTPNELSLAEEIARRTALTMENSKLYNELQATDRRKDEFLATLAHELRNPLAPIRNSLQILKMPRVDAATAQHSREMMERQVHHLVRLVDDLLDVSRVMRGKVELRKEPVELATVVARAVETVQPLIEVQGHHLSIALPAESMLLDADPVRLAQVIGNLLTNSAKYTDSNGSIWLSASRSGDMAELRVRDSGIGIASDILPHVFELFVQADHASSKAQGGLGIGLTLVKNLVEMHGGTVQAHSAGLGTGSEFVVRLPLLKHEPPPPMEPENVEPRPASTASGHRLLVVDDNVDAANSLAMLLRLYGHEVRVAHSGPAALELARTFRPALIFLDIGMPGMDGYEVGRRIRLMHDQENIVLTALTGWGQTEDRRRSAEAGFDHHLVKPPDPKALEQLLQLLPKPGSQS